MQLQFEQSCGLGIFVSRMGATGFPEDRRQIALREARATQILFHASTGKYIIVLDHDDILELGKDGALPQIIERKIRDIEEVSGLSDASISNLGWGEYDLPEHLAQHISVVVSDKESTTA